MDNDFIPDQAFNFTDDDRYVITLIHDPSNAELISNYDTDLILAGHSHNGEVDLLNSGTSLYINQGIGTSPSHFRLLNPPTINFYRLTSY